MIRTFLTAAAVSALAVAAQADMMDVAGVGHGQSMNEVTAINDGLVVVKVDTMYEHFESENPDNPLASVTGPCFGSMVIKAGVPQGGGNCNYSDADGDAVVMSWTAEAITEDGYTTGTWEIAGGTGKWAEASGGGTFRAGTDADGMYSNTVTGEINM